MVGGAGRSTASGSPRLPSAKSTHDPLGPSLGSPSSTHPQPDGDLPSDPQATPQVTRTPSQMVLRLSMLTPRRSSQTLRDQAHASTPTTRPPTPPPSIPGAPALWYGANVRFVRPFKDGKPN